MSVPEGHHPRLPESPMNSNNNRAIFFASFMTLIAAGVGFAIRGAILKDWSGQFGFTKGDLGIINGFGLVGFGFTIIICSVFADRVGYKPLMVLAFLLHVASALLTFAATPLYDSILKSGGAAPTPETIEKAKNMAMFCLKYGALLFSLANGVCESVINPLVATLFPKQKTHYLNILHAGWPGGLILGAILATLFCGDGAYVMKLRWEFVMAFFLPPTLIYGLIVLKEKFPESEAKAAGVSFGTALLEFFHPVLLMLLILHAMVGYVELGTDSWITNIMENVIPKQYALLLFIWTSGIMFVLRFFAGPIVERINPLGLLFISACLGSVGLYSLGNSQGMLAILIAGTVYGVGKTFLWPTMLGVVGERFPKGGALTMGTLGGVGMLSAGLLGGPGIGFKQDYFASQKLEQAAPETYGRFKASEAKSYLDLPGLPKVTGLDGKKVEALEDKVKEKTTLTATEKKDVGPVKEASIYGGQMALKWTAMVPAMMAVGYLILVAYFAATGGYKQEHLQTVQPISEA